MAYKMKAPRPARKPTKKVPPARKAKAQPSQAPQGEAERKAEFWKHFEASYQRNEEALKRLAKL